VNRLSVLKTTKIYSVELRNLSTNTMISNTSISLRIRSRKPIAVGFAAWLILSQLCGGCKDNSKSDYSVEAMGSCRQQTSIRIIDESNGVDTGYRYIATSQDPRFRDYVDTISTYVFKKIDAMGQCKDNPQIELVFVYRPLISQGIAPFNFEQTKSGQTQYLDSPWVKLTIDRSPKLMVRAAFMWNQRQFMLDQALLSGARADPSKPLLPIDLDTLKKFVEDYKKNVVKTPLREASTVNGPDNASRRFKEAETAALSQISQRLPADLFWLFRRSIFASEFPAPENDPLEETISERKTAYAKISKALVDRRFSSIKPNQYYQNIFDLKDITNIDKYRIIDKYQINKLR
jgi:hypothetical protein